MNKFHEHIEGVRNEGTGEIYTWPSYMCVCPSASNIGLWCFRVITLPARATCVSSTAAGALSSLWHFDCVAITKRRWYTLMYTRAYCVSDEVSMRHTFTERKREKKRESEFIPWYIFANPFQERLCWSIFNPCSRNNVFYIFNPIAKTYTENTTDAIPRRHWELLGII